MNKFSDIVKSLWSLGCFGLLFVACVFLAVPVSPAVGQAFHPDAKNRRQPTSQPVRLESLTYVNAAKPAKKTQSKFELKDGDRVVFLGNTLIERAQKYGYWETMLTARYPNKKIIFRNLGWDGDTVWAESRGIFESPAKGYQKMLTHVGRLKPTVIFLGYGNNEVFAGKSGLPRFIKQYNKLMDDLTKASAKGVRFVLLSPTLREDLQPPLPKATEFNKSIAEYSNAIRQISEERGLQFVDLFFKFHPALNMTFNGIHFSRAGYWFGKDVLVSGLGHSEPIWNVSLSSKGKTIHANGCVVKQIQSMKNGLRFTVEEQNIPNASFSNTLVDHSYRRLQISGLPEGLYQLRIDNKNIWTYASKSFTSNANAKSWAIGRRVLRGPDYMQTEKLRQAIIAKNELYFHSWRPQNITYLFLFRKHEQGKNAKDVKEFLKLVAEKEQEIDRLKKPVTRTYELIRVKPKK